MVPLFFVHACRKKGRKRQDRGRQIPVMIYGMLRTPATLRDRDIAIRLHRGFGSAPSPLPVEAMARAACFSLRQFHRLMVQVLGETPGTRQRRLRLDRAAWLLLKSRGTVLDIALETGWESHETFTRAFRTRFCVTPSSFRKTRGAAMPRSIRIALSIAKHAAHSAAATA